MTLDELVQASVNQQKLQQSLDDLAKGNASRAKERRKYAVLQAAATLYGYGKVDGPNAAVNEAFLMLEIIEQREKEAR